MMMETSSGSDGVPLRRVSRPPFAPDAEQLNPLWLALVPIMEWITKVDDPSSRDADSAERRALYTAARTDLSRQDRTSAYKATLPEDLRSLPDDQFGYTEADVVHWTRHVPERPLLQLVGHRGSGKSTLLRYLFQHLPPQCPTMREYWPIFLDLRNCNNPPFAIPDDPTVEELVTNLLHRIYEFASASEQPGLQPVSTPVNFVGLLERRGFALPSTAAPLSLIDVATSVLSEAAHASNKYVIFIFDNLDQLHPLAIGRTFQLAAALCAHPSTRVILPQRPWNDNLHAVQIARKGGLISWRIRVNPPDMHNVLRRRFQAEELRKYFQMIPRLPLAGGVQLEFRSVRHILNQLLDFFTRTRFADRLLLGLCDTDTRRKIAAVRSLLRWPDLPVRDFLFHETLSRAGTAVDTSEHLRHHHLMAGVVCGANTHFVQTLNPMLSPVLNIYDDPAGAHQGQYTLLFRVLQLCLTSGTFVSKTTLLDWCAALGYSRSAAIAAITSLLRWGLLYSPESDWTTEHVSSLRINTSGQYYLLYLIQDADYTFQVIQDTPLPHLSWKQPSVDDVVSRRYDSMLELLHGVCRCERDEMEALRRDLLRYGEPARLAMQGPFLSSIVAKAVVDKLRDGEWARHDTVKRLASDMRRRIEGTDLPEVDAHLARIRAFAAQLPVARASYEELGRYRLETGISAVVRGPQSGIHADDGLYIRLDGVSLTSTARARNISAVVELKSPAQLAGSRCAIIHVSADTSRQLSKEVLFPLHASASTSDRLSGDIWFLEGDSVLGGGSFPR